MNDKAPGLDGYTFLFLKRSSDIIGRDFIAAVRYLFDFSSLLRCVDVTRITLAPKIENFITMNDFRPISCCNVMYKCISKLIVNMLKIILLDFIGPIQFVFVHSKSSRCHFIDLGAHR